MEILNEGGDNGLGEIAKAAIVAIDSGLGSGGTFTASADRSIAKADAVKPGFTNDLDI